MAKRIRRAKVDDLCRIAEIFVFNNRLFYYPIFRDAAYSFDAVQVLPLANGYFAAHLGQLFVCEEEVVKGFLLLDGEEIVKLYVEPAFQGDGVGAALLDFAEQRGAAFLWALEKNTRAIGFYRRHGWLPTGEKTFEEGTTEYLLKLKKSV